VSQTQGSANGRPPSGLPVPAPPADGHDEFEPLLRALGDECRRIIEAAHTEADRLRTEAREESHRMLAEARREECTILERAARMQATLYEEVQAEVDRRLRESDEQRASILRHAEADATALRQAATDRPSADTKVAESAAPESAGPENAAAPERSTAPESAAPESAATPGPTHASRPLKNPSTAADLNVLLAEVAGTTPRANDDGKTAKEAGAARAPAAPHEVRRRPWRRSP
jgi:hypothetical protein